MDTCVFCKIIRREIPSNIVYETEEVICILDINPVNEGHTLVVPKQHSTDLQQIEEDEVGKLFATTRRISKYVLHAVGAHSYRIISNIGKEAGQEIFHTHIHLIPYHSGPRADRKELAKSLVDTLDKISQAFKLGDAMNITY